MQKINIAKKFNVNEKEEKSIMNKNYVVAGIISLALLGGGYYYYFAKKPMQPQMPPINVVVDVVSEEVIDTTRKYVGLVEAINMVDVVAKVSGTLNEVNFEEGSLIKKDDELFVIDRKRYQANYNLAKAQLLSAEANLTKATRDFARQKELTVKQIASKATFDSSESAYLQAKAAVSQAQASLDLAEIDLNNTGVKAYIDGVIGKTSATVGNYITASAGTMATVVQLDPIRITFSLTDKEFLKMKANNDRNLNNYQLNITLADGSVISQVLDTAFSSNVTNQETATIAIYVDVKNENGLLSPGAYIDVAILEKNPRTGLVVSEKTLVQNDGQTLLYVVDEGGVVSYRPVEIGETYNGKQVILSGISAGEKVISSGLQNRMLRPGANVNVVKTN